MKRTIIKIDENVCNGCGNCVTGCHEGALQLIDGKAVMVSELYCDGLGACIGECPVNAIVLEEREAEPTVGAPKGQVNVLKPAFSLATATSEHVSELRQFPIQLHLLNPQAPSFQGANVLLAADCTAFAVVNFHSNFLKGKKLAIACPKLDSNIDHYLEKLESMIDDSLIDMLTVLIMEVPCCSGLVGIAKTARDRAKRHIPIKVIMVSVQGDFKKEEWL